jgi:hypothetical protein
VVEIVIVVVAAVADETVTGLVTNVTVGGCKKPAGPTMLAVSATLPVKLVPGVTVMVEVLPVAAPAVRLTAEPETAKDVTVSVTEVDAVL